MARTKKYCSICHKEYSGWGNNALPVNSGRCCDYCNLNLVVFARWDILIGDGIVTRDDQIKVENDAENSQKKDA